MPNWIDEYLLYAEIERKKTPPVQFFKANVPDWMAYLRTSHMRRMGQGWPTVFGFALVQKQGR